MTIEDLTHNFTVSPRLHTIVYSHGRRRYTANVDLDHVVHALDVPRLFSLVCVAGHTGHNVRMSDGAIFCVKDLHGVLYL